MNECTPSQEMKEQIFLFFPFKEVETGVFQLSPLNAFLIYIPFPLE